MKKSLLALSAAVIVVVSVGAAYAQSTRNCSTTYDSRGRIQSKTCY